MRTVFFRLALMLSLWVIGMPAMANSNIAVYRSWDGVLVSPGGWVQYSRIAAGGVDSRRFRIDNSGDTALRFVTLSGIVSGPCFVQMNDLPNPIAAGSSGYVRIDFMGCSTPGDYSATVKISSNDPDTPTYQFTVGGTVAPPPSPDVAVFRPNGNEVKSGDSFAFATIATGAIDERRFRIDNTGTLDLNISNASSLVSGACFSQTETPATPVAAGASTYFSVRFACSAPGPASGAVTIVSDDPDESTFRLNLSGTATAPDIAVTRTWDGAAVSSGGSFDYGNVPVGVADTRRFRIDNTGNTTLDLSNPSSLVSGACFAQTETPAPSVAAGGYTYFSVRYLCGAAGLHTGTVTIRSDDPDENPFLISLSGTSYSTAVPDIAVARAWDGGAVPTGGSFAFPDPVGINQADSRLFRIDNTGTATLTITNPSTFVSGACFSLIELPASSIAPGASTTFRVRLSCATAGFYAGSISIASNDPDETPYSIALSGTIVRNNAAFVSQSFPVTMTAGVAYDVSVTLKNTGGTTWTAAGNDRLGIRPDTAAATWNAGRIDLPSTEAVAPGATKTFSFRLRAPTTPGTYSFQWRMVEEFVEWFGDTTPLVTITVAKNDAAFVSQSIPASMVAGKQYAVSVTMRNTGGTTWTSGANYKLGSQVQGDPWTARVLLSATSLISGSDVTFSWTVTAPATPGTYDFQFRMVQEFVMWFGAATPLTSISVRAATPPVIQSISSPTIPSGGVTDVTLLGSRFSGATVRVPHRADGKPSPAAQLMSVNAAGTEMVVRLDATNPLIDGFYAIFVENADGKDEVEVRVLPARPVVDSYTPSQASWGDVYFISISGPNLDGATISSPSPAVQFIDVGGSDGTLSGLIYVTPGTGTLSTQIEVRNASGMTALPLELGDRSTITKTTKAAGNDSNGDSVFLQWPTQVTFEDKAKDGFVFDCRFSHSYTRGHNGYIVLLRNGRTHKPEANVLAGMSQGETRSFETLIIFHSISVTSSLTVTCNSANPGDVDIEFCLDIVATAVVVGVGGQTIEAAACLGPGGDTVAITGSGFSNFSYQFGTAVGATSCSSVVDTSPDPAYGIRQATATLNECCEDPLYIDALFTLSAGGELVDLRARIPSPTPSNICYSGEPIAALKMDAFIPVNYVTSSSPIDCCNIPEDPLDLCTQRAHAGDDRGYKPNPADTECRIRQIVRIGAGKSETLVGTSRAYSGDVLWGDNHINRNCEPGSEGCDEDLVMDDCFKTDHVQKADLVTGTIQPIISKGGVYVYHLVAGGRDPNVGGSPQINWDVQVTVDTNTNRFSVSGSHDCYPAYEIWWNDQQLYGYMPTTHTAERLSKCLPSTGTGGDVTITCENRPIGQPCLVTD